MSNDFDLGSTERLINLINKDNVNNQYGIVINDRDVTFSEPVDVPEGDKNTEITLTSIPNTRTVGSVTVRYNRLDLNGLKELADIPLTIEEGNLSTSSVIEQLNNVYGCSITEDELEAFTVSDVDFEGSLITLTAKDSSLAWINEIELLVKLDQDLLSNVFVNTELSGLSWPYIFQNLMRNVLESNSVVYSLIRPNVHNVIWPYVPNKVLLLTSTVNRYNICDLDNTTMNITESASNIYFGNNPVVLTDPNTNRFLQLIGSTTLVWTDYTTNIQHSSYALANKYATSGGDGICVKEYGIDKLLVIYDRKLNSTFKLAAIVLDRETLTLIEDRGYLDITSVETSCKYTAYQNLTYLVEYIIRADRISSAVISVYNEDTNTLQYIAPPEMLSSGTEQAHSVQLTNTKGNLIISFTKYLNAKTNTFVYAYDADNGVWNEVISPSVDAYTDLHLTKINDIGAMVYRNTILNKTFVTLIE